MWDVVGDLTVTDSIAGSPVDTAKVRIFYVRHSTMPMVLGSSSQYSFDTGGSTVTSTVVPGGTLRNLTSPAPAGSFRFHGSILVTASMSLGSKSPACVMPALGTDSSPVRVEYSDDALAQVFSSLGSITILPIPTVTSFTPTFTSYRGNALITVVGSNFNDSLSFQIRVALGSTNVSVPANVIDSKTITFRTSDIYACVM